MWNEATKRRVDALMAAVPTELAGPAAHLATPLRRTIDLLSTGQAVDLQQTSKAAGWTEPAVEEALSGLVHGIAQHFGIEATSAAIMEALAGGPISASSLS